MPERPIWHGHLKLSLVNCPVLLYSAISRRNEIHFNLLNPETNARIRMQPIDISTGEEVRRSDLIKGYQYAKDQYVIVTDEELDKLETETSHMIDIEKFVPINDVPSAFFEQPYFLVPDGEVGQDAYNVIREAMRKTEKLAIAKLVISRRERLIAIVPEGRGMLVHSLRNPTEVRDSKIYFEDIPSTKSKTEMVDIAIKIIEQKSGVFNFNDFEDHYETRLRAVLDAKMKGIEPPHEEELTAPSNVVDLMAALKESLGKKQSSKKQESNLKKGSIHKLPKKQTSKTRMSKTSANRRRHRS